MVGVVGFEPTASSPQTTHSDQTELHTDKLATGLGIEPSQYSGQSTMPSHLANL